MSKMSPQKRSASSLETLIKSRKRSEARAELDDWLERGWNPLAPQEGSIGRAWSGMEMMMILGGWSDWIEANKQKWAALAKSAYVAGPDGKLRGGSRLLANVSSRHGGGNLETLLACGLDPNERGANGAPPIFQATRSSAEALLAAGANPMELDGSGKGLWEEWALRVAMKQLKFEDLEWIEKACPPPARLESRPRQSPLGSAALFYNAPEVAEAVARRWPDPAVFGIQKDEELRDALIQVMWKVGGCEGLVSALGEACGWERTIKAATASLEPGSTSVGPRPSAMGVAMIRGLVKTLGVLEERGLLNHKKASELAMEAAELGSKRPALWARENIGRGIAWAVGRMEKGEEEIARSVFKQAAAAGGVKAMKIAERMATRGWLPSSGDGSLASVYQDGALWEERELNRPVSYAEFSALCEKKAIRQSSGVKSKAKAPARGVRL